MRKKEIGWKKERMEEEKKQQTASRKKIESTRWEEKLEGDKGKSMENCFIPSLLETLIFRILPQVQKLLSCSYLKTADCLPVISLDLSLIFSSFHSTAHTDFTPATSVRWTQSANTSHWILLWAAMSGEGLIDMRLNSFEYLHSVAHYKM